MKSERKKYGSVEEYISDFPVGVKKVLKELRKVLRAAAPGAEEVISYNMPALKQDGVLVYFAAAKEHLGFYPTGSGVAAFKDRLTEYETSKGTVRLPYDRPLPAKLITDIVRFRVAENGAKAELKKAKLKAPAKGRTAAAKKVY